MHEESPKPEEEFIITSKPSILVEDEHVPSNKESLAICTQQQQQQQEEEEEEADDEQSSTESASASNYEQQITGNSIEAEQELIEDSSSATGSGEIKMQQQDIDPTCKHCARSFKSLKALFGHMRTHPKEDEACTSSCSNQMTAAALVIYDADQPEAKRVKLERAAADGRYACHICSMTFPTHQALGGHIAFHNKLKQGEDGSGQAPRASRRKASEDGELHKCKECGAVFKTGQSLGGHMRKHFDLQKLKRNVKAPPSEETKQLPSTIEEDAATRKDHYYEEEIALLENVRGECGDGSVSDFIEMAEAEAEEMCRLKL